MASSRMLSSVVTLFNYQGEVRDRASYQETILKNCYCTLSEGSDLNNQGKKANNSARLYIFDEKTIATAADGTERSFLPYEEWKALADKSPYWTLSDKGSDYFIKAGSTSKLKIVSVSHKKAGRRRMWHFEVDGR